MMAILLCAGFATRLYPLTRDFPKALLPVAGRPVIDYLVEQV
ncbi:MAG: sugar phosphate nucleotidyltransferase, partial [Desulfobacterales bacterium]